MADELNLSISLAFAKGNLSGSRSVSDTIDVAGGAMIHAVQTIGTSAETIVIQAEIATAGYAFFRNLDANNFVKLGPDSAGLVDFVKLMPGQCAVLPLATTTIKAIADTASCNLEYWIIEA